MRPTIDRQTLTTLLTEKTMKEIAASFGITVGSVSRLITCYGLPRPKYIQSEETKRRRAEALKRAHLRDPELARRQTQKIREHAAAAKGKSVEEIFGAEAAARFRDQARARSTGRVQTKEVREKKRAALLGRTIHPRARQLLSEGRKRGFREGTLSLSPTAGFGKGGYRNDIGHYVRSEYEHLFALRLRALGLSYEYEARTFAITLAGKESSFTPDFRIGDRWFEIKNPFNVTVPEFLEKLDAFKRQYPDDSITIVVGNATWLRNPYVIDEVIRLHIGAVKAV